MLESNRKSIIQSIKSDDKKIYLLEKYKNQLLKSHIDEVIQSIESDDKRIDLLNRFESSKNLEIYDDDMFNEKYKEFLETIATYPNATVVVNKELLRLFEAMKQRGIEYQGEKFNKDLEDIRRQISAKSEFDKDNSISLEIF